MMAGWQPVGTDVFRYDDTCAVYLLRHGDHGLLIDLGGGDGLAALAEVGVTRLDGIWLTHAHRDQWQGFAVAQAAGATVHLPAAARSFVDPAERDDFRRLAPGHLAYPSRFHPPQPHQPVSYDVQPQAAWRWGSFRIEPHAAPGHIDHQLAYLVEGPDGSFLFCGDAVAGRGVVHEAFCLEHDHYTGGGARLAADTLCRLRNLRADRLCPSHGPVLAEAVWDAFDETVDRLRRLADLKDTCLPRRPAVRRLAAADPGTFCRLSDHLWLWQNSYFLVSDEGPVLMVDVQTQLDEAFHTAYAEALGDRPIEVVLVTHIHCDHVMGVEHLRQTWPLACWAHETLVEPIANPYAFARPWLHNHPTTVDLPLQEGEPVRWREYELTAWWFPGQTDLHACYETVVDGRRALFAGDNFYPPQQWGGTGGLCGYNGGHPRLWRLSAELVMRLGPDWILSSHMQPFPFRRADFEAVVDWSERVAALMRALAPDGNLERHHSPHFIEARPYVQPAAPVMFVGLRVTNTYPEPLELVVTPVLPEGIVGDVSAQTVSLAPGETDLVGFGLSAADGLAGMRLVTFDVVANGQRWGELVECYVRGAGNYLGQ